MWIDLSFIVVAAAGFYWGYSRGIIKTVVAIAAIFIGFILAVRFSPQLTQILSDLFNRPPDGMMPLLGFVTSFVLVLALMRLLATVVERVLTKLHINFVNQIAGGLSIAIVVTFLYSLVLGLVNTADLIPLRQKADSYTYDSLEEFPEQVYAVLGEARPAFEKVRDSGREAMGE